MEHPLAEETNVLFANLSKFRMSLLTNQGIFIQQKVRLIAEPKMSFME